MKVRRILQGRRTVGHSVTPRSPIDRSETVNGPRGAMSGLKEVNSEWGRTTGPIELLQPASAPSNPVGHISRRPGRAGSSGGSYIHTRGNICSLRLSHQCSLSFKVSQIPAGRCQKVCDLPGSPLPAPSGVGTGSGGSQTSWYSVCDAFKRLYAGTM